MILVIIWFVKFNIKYVYSKNVYNELMFILKFLLVYIGFKYIMKLMDKMKYVYN